MSPNGTQNDGMREVDIRDMSANQNQAERLSLQAYEKLGVDDALILLNDHKPQDLLDTFEREFAGSFSLSTLSTNDGEYRVRITKRASTALPRLVGDTTGLLTNITPDAQGSIWQLEPGARDLDSNIIALPAHDEIGLHVGPELDVVIVVLQGSGTLHTELNRISLQQGSIVWLPRKAQRQFTAGPDGLYYFSVHQRKPALGITTAPK